MPPFFRASVMGNAKGVFMATSLAKQSAKDKIDTLNPFYHRYPIRQWLFRLRKAFVFRAFQLREGAFVRWHKNKKPFLERIDKLFRPV